MSDNKQLLTVEQMAEVLSVPPSWIYQRTRLGVSVIPHIKIGKYVRFDRDEVIRFFKSGENKV